MTHSPAVRPRGLIFLISCLLAGPWAAAQDDEITHGVRIDPSSFGPSYVESLDDAVARDRRERADAPQGESAKGRQGTWFVPNTRGTYYPHSGVHNVVNRFGDTRMGIGFHELVDVRGAYLAGQANRAVWTRGVQVIGYRGGQEVGRTDWFRELGDQPKWLTMNLVGVDRLVFVAEPAVNGAGWYALDDLTFAAHSDDPAHVPDVRVIDFEDLPYRTDLLGTNYAGLVWEMGTGDFQAPQPVPAPQVPPDFATDKPASGDDGPQAAGGGGTLPDIELAFAGIRSGQLGNTSFPPDTHGAVGPNHFVEIVNRVFAVYNKATGASVQTLGLGTFQPGTSGDPRIIFDVHSQRWIVISSNFNTRLFLAVSRTDDPTGLWFKTSFPTNQPAITDYPTLGVDANGIYTAAFITGAGSMTIFAIDKAPLVATPPTLGTVTSFSNLPFEGALQPVQTYGTPPGEYVVSRRTNTSLRLRRIDPPLTAPTLVNLSNVTVPSNATAPDAPSMGAGTPLDTGSDARLMMALYRDGFVWTCHTINVSGRAACRWYQFNPTNSALVQSGTVSDPALHFFYPSLAVNQFGNLLMGFSGSNSSQFAAAYYSGRRAGDPPGEMAPATLLRAGAGSYSVIDDVGRNRWGDYSYTSLDPVDQQMMWTIQEYVFSTNTWGTWVASFHAGDCNNNEIRDECELACGEPGGMCDLPGCGLGRDCNANGVPDECDIAGVNSVDFNVDAIPDECVIAGDADGDHDRDLFDFAHLTDCVDPTHESPASPECDPFDFDGDTFVDWSDAGAFQRSFTGNCGATITEQPMDTGVCPPSGVTSLHVTATGPSLTYHWFRNGVEIAGATQSTFTFNATAQTVGSYRVYVVSQCGSVPSDDVTVQLFGPPHVTAAPQDVSACLNAPATLSVSAEGAAPFTYQWQFDEQNLPGATGESLMLASVGPEQWGNYRCIVTDRCGQNVTSTAAIVSLQTGVEFTSHPEPGAFCEGDSIFLFATATGLPNYQWFKDGEPIPGATEFFHGITEATPTDSGTYHVEASNPCNAASSDTALITITDCP